MLTYFDEEAINKSNTTLELQKYIANIYHSLIMIIKFPS
jgi:hypothetical protein